MQIIPLAAVPSQTLSVTLNGQAAQINVYLLGFGAAARLYMDLIAGGEPILSCRSCVAYGGQANESPAFMLEDAQYQPFEGELLWLDTQASASVPTQEDPVYTGLGARWQLAYLTETDLEQL